VRVFDNVDQPLLHQAENHDGGIVRE
jgi:hypothetical protein